MLPSESELPRYEIPKMPVEDNLNINLNQNLWGLIIAYAALGAAEKFGFHHLWWLAFIVSCAMTASVLLTAIFYTIAYCKAKVR